VADAGSVGTCGSRRDDMTMAEDFGEMDDLTCRLAGPQGQVVFELGEVAARGADLEGDARSDGKRSP